MNYRSANSAFTQNFNVVQLNKQAEFVRHRVPVSASYPIEFQPLVDRFNALCALPLGWDGYRGGPVRFEIASFVLGMLARVEAHNAPLPSLIPGGDGSVQVEWHIHGFDIELDVTAPYKVDAVRRNIATGEIEEVELSDNYKLVMDWLNELQPETMLAATA